MIILKLILITAYTDVDVLEKAINQVGIWKYVKKPWDKETLKSIIDNAYLSLLKDRKNKKTFDAIEYNENRYNIAMEGSDAGLWDWDLVSNKVYFSSTWKRIIGYKNEELENKISTWESIMHPDDLLETFKHLDDYLCGKTDKYEIEFRLKHKNGYFVHILARGVGQKK
jgi:PAS domain S-box-containing protein